MTHLSISQSSIMALLTQVASFVAGFGVINSVQEGLVITAATAVVNAAFLIANAVHHYAGAQVVAAGVQSPVVTIANPPVAPPVKL